jgi:ribonuclease P protein component
MPRHARKEGLSRRHRFSERGSFAPLLRGTRKLRGRLAILHAAAARSAHSRLGIALTRRLVPSALGRNRLKRMVRETFRRHAVKALGIDCVITLRERIAADGEPALRAEILALFDQLAAGPR